MLTLGTAMIVLGQAIFLNLISRLATSWFGDKERALATSIGFLSLPFGVLLGHIIADFML